MTVPALRRLLLIAVAAASGPLPLVVQGACPPGDCKPFGECVKDTRSCGDNCEERCVCHDGFAGRDCSFMIDICPDAVSDSSSARACFNGGKCTASGSGSATTWHCDCSAAFGDAVNFQGAQCEFPGETVICEIGKTSSDYAFCVNNGECGDNMVQPGDHFKGCKCSSLFEGRHCQFPAGTAPKREMILYPTQKSHTGLGPGAIAVVVLVSLAMTAGILVWAVSVHRRRQAKDWVKQNTTAIESLDMDYDGDLQLEDVDVNDDEPPQTQSPPRGGAGMRHRELI